MVNFTSTTSQDFHENSVTDSTLLYKDGCVPLVPTGPKCNALQCKLLKELLTAGQKWKLEWHSNNKIYLDPVFYLGRHQIVITHRYLPAKCTWFIPINIHAWFPISLYRNVKGAMQYVRIRRFLQFILKTNSWQEIIKEPLCRTSIARVVFTQQELWTRTGRDVSMLTQVDTATTQYIDFITSKLLFAHYYVGSFCMFFWQKFLQIASLQRVGKMFLDPSIYTDPYNNYWGVYQFSSFLCPNHKPTDTVKTQPPWWRYQNLVVSKTVPETSRTTNK